MDALSIIVFCILVAVSLIIDLKVVGGKHRAPTMKEASIWTVVFISIAIFFGVFLYFEQGSVVASEYFNAYAIEKILSVDNLFVFILVFAYFKVPEEYHHKVLFYGILGAFVLRAIFIFLGAEFIERTNVEMFGLNVNIVLTAFGLVLVWKGIGAFREAMGSGDDEEEDFSKSPGARFITWITGGKVLHEYHGDKFFVYKNKNKDEIFEPKEWKGMVQPLVTRYGTLLLIVVGVVEFTDVVFAVDSIPAIFSVTQNKLVLYTSNIFAILGLRSMYFLLAGLLPLFRYLGYGLAIILSFIGIKMVGAPFFHIEGTTSLLIVLGVLITSIIVSLLNPEKKNV